MSITVIVLRMFFFAIFTVDQNSMNNTYKNGDRVLVYKQFRRINRYDVLIIRHHGEFFIKRCIGLPGDKIQIAQGIVSINGQALNDIKLFKIKINLDSIKRIRAYPHDFDIQDIYKTNWNIDNFGPLVIPGQSIPIQVERKALSQYDYLNIYDEDNYTLGTVKLRFNKDYYFVMGDNREFSKDSRSFGLIAADEIIGKVSLVVFPFFR